MSSSRSLDKISTSWRKVRFEMKIFILMATCLDFKFVEGVINGRIKDKGLYVIQSVAEPRYVLTVADETVEKTKLAGSLLNQVVASKWQNEEHQKWTVKTFGKHYYFLTPVEKKLNNVTYKVYVEEFPIPNVWEIHSVSDGKHWMVKLNRGKCLRFNGLESPIKTEKCDKTNENHLWNFHLLNQ